MIRNNINTALYADNKEMDSIIEAVQPELDASYAYILKWFSNANPSTADLDGIEMWERLLGIVAEPSIEDEEFRRKRIIVRLTASIPYTERTLIRLVDEIMGVGQWYYTLGLYSSWVKLYYDFKSWESVNEEFGTWEDVYGDGEEYWLHIFATNPGRNWTREVHALLSIVVPANIGWTLHMVTSSWIAVYENFETWSDVLYMHDTWEDVYLGLYHGREMLAKNRDTDMLIVDRDTDMLQMLELR